MFRILCLLLFTFHCVFCADLEWEALPDTLLNSKGNLINRTVETEDGTVSGAKYWNGDFYEFFGIPYASVPKGRDRFKAPLPPKKWDGVFEADNNKILCPQTFYTGEDSDEIYIAGEEDCLVLNLLVPEIASEENLVPVIFYIHSGGFAIGNGNMAKFNYLANHDVIVGSFNYRLGAIGFNCLGTEDIPGNAGMKDAVAALRWINRNIKKFGGDPNKVTLAGFSVGATMAELLVLSRTTDGLIDKLILESGSALNPYAINRDPINTALNVAKSLNYNGTGDIESLTEFYLKADPGFLSVKSLNFFLPNGSFGFAPCIENKIDNVEPFLTESPLDILLRGDYKKVPVLTGFANMEGISRALKFDTFSEEMNEDFSKFLPVDLNFDNENDKQNVVSEVKEKYFNNEEVTLDNLKGYVDYFSDSLFKYHIIKSANLHSANSKRPVFLYEFSYVGKLNLKHDYGFLIEGASHRDQTSYLLDFYSFAYDTNDMDMIDRMTAMWTDFAKFEDPVAYESPVVDFKWPPYTGKDPHRLVINVKTESKRDIPLEGYNFWNNIYEKYYWTPNAPIAPKLLNKGKSDSEQKGEEKNKRNNKEKRRKKK